MRLCASLGKGLAVLVVVPSFTRTTQL